jgi:hypothetical protein
MSVSHIPEKVKIRLWGKAGGRCQYRGCNKPLWYDSLTKVEFNISYIAHIIADSPDGPRGDAVLSETLKDDLSNLMLCCDEHHRLIDKEDVEGHTVEKLREMKKRHEERIELLTSLIEGRRSHILLYGANIGKHSSRVSWDKATSAMTPDWYPAYRQAIELSLINSSFQDFEPKFWEMERENLIRQFNQKVKPLLSSSEVKHYSVFAFAPQPLLIELGFLLSDIPVAEVYQLHREPPDWKWQNTPTDFDYVVEEPNNCYPTVALNLSLSATINSSRITSVLGNDISIWTMKIENPNNDYLRGREQLTLFRQCYRRLLNGIKVRHGEKALIHLFPAVPIAVAVEIGRVWMPKADLPFRIYDQNRKGGGFVETFNIINE